MDINSLLEKIGYRLHNRKTDTTPLNFYYYRNPDGSVRWLWPAASTRPLFLKFYHAAGWRPRIFCAVTRVVFRLGLQGILFRKTSVAATPLAHAPVKEEDTDWAVFSGTPGPNRKILCYTSCRGKGTFTKIALGKNSGKLIDREFHTLQALRKMDIASFVFPQSREYAAGYLKADDIAAANSRHTNVLTPAHFAALSELFTHTERTTTLHALPAWHQTQQILGQLWAAQDPRLPKGMLRKLKMISEQIGNRPITTCLAHGDFTPWNMQLADNKLAIYDWELSQDALPAGFDAFHYIIQNGILVKRQAWRDINVALQTVAGERATGIPDGEHELYLALYLVIQTVYYLDVFTQQGEWHRQVYWLLNTWNDGLSACLKNAMPHRALVLMDLLDFMLHRRYATLKFSGALPETISELSDIDLCIEEKDHTAISAYLAQHSLVRHHQGTTKTFMATEQVLCADSSVLSVDLIWRLKRKAIDMMAVGPIIEAAVLHGHGVKSASAMDNARYVALFYALNGSEVPAHYLRFEEHLSGLQSTEDKRLKFFYSQPRITAPVIANDIQRRRVNRGLSALGLKIAYICDVIKSYAAAKGMVITFSGVDGAGKSTVIENLRLRIEKQLRRKVVVLRHRPSVLPILSAWTKGKAAAERDSMAKLPRQGTNQNPLSSLMRFAYYYCDYLFGQVWVYARYVRQGYVVIYDRYYFDFINDCRRSNIALPRALLRLGYLFIIEPDLNFFLYADAELILSRKQELDKTSIEELTQRYLSLFNQLDKRNVKNRYIPIQNVNLSDTLREIMNNVLHTAA